jgi:hypothetical protein
MLGSNKNFEFTNEFRQRRRGYLFKQLVMADPNSRFPHPASESKGEAVMIIAPGEIVTCGGKID